ncbi:MAG: alpha/beta hydrolase [Gammaproteobacteria bacterium]
MPRFSITVSILIAFAVLGSGCSPVLVVNALTPTDTYNASLDIAYGPDPRQKVDIYQPRSAPQAPLRHAAYPVVVFFHGGSWNYGDRKDYKFVGEALASRGIVAVVADYRLYPQVRYPDFLKDCAQAVAWTRREAAHYGGNPQQLFLMGHSAGAYNAAMLALDPRWLAAQGISPAVLAGWIGLAGPYDFLPIINPDAQPVFNHPNYPAGTQPIAYVSGKSPRVFLGAPIKDSVVNPERNTQQLANKLRAAGVSVTLKRYDNVNHITLIGTFARPLRALAPVLEDVVGFVREEK